VTECDKAGFFGSPDSTAYVPGVVRFLFVIRLQQRLPAVIVDSRFRRGFLKKSVTVMGSIVVFNFSLP
jgi:hypothetical protein